MRIKIIKFFFVALIAILVAIWAEIAKSPADNGARIYFFDVGQGDATLLSRGDFQVLIDGGPDSDILAKVGEVMPPRDREIEIMILTHPHADHLVGLNQILERYNVKKVYLSGVVHTSNQYLEFLQKIKDVNIETIVPEINERVVLFDNAVLEFLWPGQKYREQEIDNINNSSVINRFCYFEKCVLFLGDLELDGQSEMLTNNTVADFSAEIIKISHHGSINGTNQKILDTVRPKFAIISVGGDNKYGHPHAATIDLLGSLGIKLLRTDRDGSAEFLFSEEGVFEK